MSKRIVVTGIGVVSPVGSGKDTFWGNLLKGKSGIKKVTLFDTSKYLCHNAGEVNDFNPEDHMPRRVARLFGRATQLAIASTEMALADAGLSHGTVRREKIGGYRRGNHT